jgi:hypothetical protein
MARSPDQRVAVIAGAGTFPLQVAREAKRQGWWVLGVGLAGWVDGPLREVTDAYEELPVGALGRLLERLRAHQVRQAVMAGKVTKRVLFDDPAAFDAEMTALLAGAKDRTVNGLLGAVGERLRREGVTLVDSAGFLASQLCPAGPVTSRAPTAAERADIDAGVRAARRLADLDIGQTVVVKGGVIVAVEALEGTDAAVQRARDVAGPGLVVVKCASPAQDRRFDLPVIGPKTMATLCAAGVTCLAVDAGATLLLSQDALLAQANASGLSLVGLPPSSP